jgi:3-deoxy-7-phosphoheptulonate synthase
MVEVHHAPETALSDGAQSLYPEQFEALCRQVTSIHTMFSPYQDNLSDIKRSA